MPASTIVEYDVTIPLRDGVVTRANVIRPARGRVPVLLSRSSYGKDARRNEVNTLDPFRAARHGYAVVIQDIRGRFASDGVFRPFFQEIEDGYDTVEWCAAQPWCDGRVGMFGRSYLGATQWLAALAGPPGLRAIAPGLTASNYYEGWTYQGGAFQLGFALAWAAFSLALGNVNHLTRHGSPDLARRKRRHLIELVNDLYRAYAHLPLTGWRELDEFAPYYREWLEHPVYDDYWRRTAARERYHDLSVPAFNYGGWFDIFRQGTLENFTGMRAKGQAAGREARLLMGPWGHGRIFSHHLGERNFGVDASPDAADLDGEQLRFFDFWLRDHDDGYADRPPVKIFVMGADHWREEQSWPLERTCWTSWYLRGGGRANSLNGDGRLSPEAPPGNEPPDRFTYDPRDPVPSRGGALHASFAGVLPPGPFDQRTVERREDVLVYTSPPLEDDLEITGPVDLELWVTSSAPDTDFTGKLVDVYPDGRALCVTDGILRARYRRSWQDPEPLQPNEPVLLRIRLGDTSQLFRKGHRLRLEVSSSNFPRFDRHPNVYAPLLAAVAEGRPAVQTVLHDAEHPSRLVLPVIPDA